MAQSAGVLRLVREALAGVKVSGKCGRDYLQGLLAGHVNKAGLLADQEDAQQFLRAGMPVWRSKDTGQVEQTTGRRRIDIVVHDDRKPIALIETESDLNDLKRAGVTNRSGHYDVSSIAHDSSGAHFDSYKSLERMAAAAHYWARHAMGGTYPDPSSGVATLEQLRSDTPDKHNPLGLELILVSGSCRTYDAGILSRRLVSLGAELVCVTEK